MYETNEPTNEVRDADVAGVARLICGNLIEREMPRTTIYEHLDAGSASTTLSFARSATSLYTRGEGKCSPDRARYSNERRNVYIGENCFDRRIIDNPINFY